MTRAVLESTVADLDAFVRARLFEMVGPSPWRDPLVALSEAVQLEAALEVLLVALPAELAARLRLGEVLDARLETFPGVGGSSPVILEAVVEGDRYLVGRATSFTVLGALERAAQRVLRWEVVSPARGRPRTLLLLEGALPPRERGR